MYKLKQYFHSLVMFFTLLLIAVPTAQAATYYVSNSGSDSASGAQGSPFKTIQHAADVAKAGDTVIVMPGTYRESIESKNDGTASARIRFVSQEKWGAKIISSDANVSWSMFGDYTDVEGFDVTASNNAHVGISSYANYTKIMYNYVHDYKMVGPCDSNGGAGILSAKYDTVGKQIIGNVVQNIGTNFIGPGTEYCNKIHGIYHGTQGGGVYDNVVSNSASAGIHLWHAPVGATVANNVSYNNRGVGVVFGCGDKPYVQCSGITIANNIFMNNGSMGIREYGNNDSSNKVLNNITYQNGGDEIVMKQGTATGNKTDVNPMLDSNMKPLAGSPAIGAGVSIPGISGSPPNIGLSGAVSHDIPAGNFTPGGSGGAGGGGNYIPGIGNCPPTI
jgi:hypothetical protein